MFWFLFLLFCSKKQPVVVFSVVILLRFSPGGREYFLLFDDGKLVSFSVVNAFVGDIVGLDRRLLFIVDRTIESVVSLIFVAGVGVVGIFVYFNDGRRKFGR